MAERQRGDIRLSCHSVVARFLVHADLHGTVMESVLLASAAVLQQAARPRRRGDKMAGGGAPPRKTMSTFGENTPRHVKAVLERGTSAGAGLPCSAGHFSP